MDENEWRRAHHAFKDYLKTSLVHYRLALSAGPSLGPQLRSVFRVVSLWFNHMSDADVNAQMTAMVREVPSYKVGGGGGWWWLKHQLKFCLSPKYPSVVSYPLDHIR